MNDPVYIVVVEQFSVFARSINCQTRDEAEQAARNATKYDNGAVAYICHVETRVDF